MNPVLTACLLILLQTSVLSALDYKNDILPIFKQHCWKCHSSENEIKGDLALDNLEDMANIHINDIGTIRPGFPEKSDLLARLKLGEGDDDFMPRKGAALRNSEISKIERWIEEGAILDAAAATEAELKRAEEVKWKRAKSGETFLTWTSPDGKTIEAKFLRLEDESVRLIGRNGRNYTVPFTFLSEESIEMAKKIDATKP